jgi:hypothetical protein
LVDRGANGCIAGSDLKLIDFTGGHTDLSGIDDHTVRNLKIARVGGVTKSSKGDIIIIINQAAYMPDGRTILSTGQMEHFKIKVNDKSKRVTGKTPSIITLEGQEIPMETRKGLPYISLRKGTKEEWDTLPQIEITSPHEWDPSVLDCEVTNDWFTTRPKLPMHPGEAKYNDKGELVPQTVVEDVEEEDSDDEDRRLKSLNRGGIKTFLSRLVKDETVKDFMVCNIEGIQHEMRHDDDWDPRFLDDEESIPPLYKESQVPPLYQPTTSDSDDSDDEELWTRWKEGYHRRSRAAQVTTRSSSKKKNDKGEPKDATKKATTKASKKETTKRSQRKNKGKPITTKDEERGEHAPTIHFDDHVDEPDPDSTSIDPVPPHLEYNNRARTLQEIADEMGQDLSEPNGETGTRIAGIEPRLSSPSKKNVEEYSMYFPGTDLETLRKTFDATTQYGSKGATEGHTLRNQIKSPNPILNIKRRHEEVATDTMYSNTPAFETGSTAAQFFIGRKSHFRSARKLGSSDKDFKSTLEDEIRKYGAMDRLVSDNAKAQVSDKVKEVLRTFAIDDWQSEPYKGNQNFAERGWRDTKRKVNALLNNSGAPDATWMLALEYICFVQNHTAVDSLGGRTPIEWLLGVTPDISVLLQFRFWEPVYYMKYDEKFPSDSTELLGRFVGISENVGHAMTYKILTEDDKIIHRAVARSALKTGGFDNRKAKAAAPKGAPEDVLHHVSDKEKAEIEEVLVEDVSDDEDEEEDDTKERKKKFRESCSEDVLRSLNEDRVRRGVPLPTLDTSGLLGRSFIPNPDEEGEQHRGKIVGVEETGDLNVDGNEELYKFRCKVGEKEFERILTLREMQEWCERDSDKDDMYRIEAILDHKKSSKAKGGWLLLILWASGERTWNQLSPTLADDPISVSLYAMKNGLLYEPGFKRCRSHVKSSKKLARMINQTKLRNFRNKPVYMYGYQVPRNHDEAVFIDERNGNTKWQDAEQLEIAQLFEYDTFKDLGKGTPIPKGYQKIPCHMVYAVKHDGRHKARMVAGGHRTETPIDSTYSSVVSLPGLRLVTFLAELNQMELWGTDIGNAYLESYTEEKVCFIAGGEFGDLAGHTFMILKAQYGLKSSGKRWHDRLFDVLFSMGFRPSKAEEDIWMRDKGDHYEYIACYVDDLAIASRDPQSIIDALEGAPNSFKLKGTGPMEFHLGCDFFRDEYGTLCIGPRKYIDRMEAQHESLFGHKPKTNVSSPLEKNDHPELDDSPLLDEDGINKYQSLIGVLQWAITLGRFDIATAVMTMSGFRVAPTEGHLQRVQRICGYLSKMKHGYLRVRTDEPDYSDLPKKHYSWERSVYGNVTELIPHDIPKPLGKRVVSTSYVDANLNHDLLTGRSVTGVLHFVNQTPVHWFTKKQPTVETATYGSEFIAAKLAVEQIMAMRLTLRYLGVEVHGATKLFGDNGSVVTSSSVPESPLRKRHQALAYHYTREAIASGAVDFHHLPGTLNPSDILSKHWGYAQVWPMLKTTMFWAGNTSELLTQDDLSMRSKGSDKCLDLTKDSSTPKESTEDSQVSKTALPNEPGKDRGDVL